MIWENIYTRLLYFSLFVWYLFQYNDLSNPLLKSFDSFWLFFADKVTTWTYSFLSLIVKILLLDLASSFSLPIADKTQWFVHLSFNSTFQLINGISSDLQKLLNDLKKLLIKIISCRIIDTIFEWKNKQPINIPKHWINHTI